MYRFLATTFYRIKLEGCIFTGLESWGRRFGVDFNWIPSVVSEKKGLDNKTDGQKNQQPKWSWSLWLASFKNMQSESSAVYPTPIVADHRLYSPLYPIVALCFCKNDVLSSVQGSVGTPRRGAGRLVWFQRAVHGENGTESTRIPPTMAPIWQHANAGGGGGDFFGRTRRDGRLVRGGDRFRESSDLRAPGQQ